MIQGWDKYLNMKRKTEMGGRCKNPFGLGKCENLTGHPGGDSFTGQLEMLAFNSKRLGL